MNVPSAAHLQAVLRSSGPLTPAQAARVGLAVLQALTEVGCFRDDGEGLWVGQMNVGDRSR
jgi:hypothetical protein